MEQHNQEYRYSKSARQRAVLLATASAVVLVVMLVSLAQQWTFFGWPTRAVFGLLTVGLVFTVRAQLLRLWFRLCLSPDAVQIATPLTKRTIRWDDIAEVRRLAMRQVGGERRWACAVYTRTQRGTTLPTYLFDDQVEDAEEAFAAIEHYVQHSTTNTR